MPPLCLKCPPMAEKLQKNLSDENMEEMMKILSHINQIIEELTNSLTFKRKMSKPKENEID